MVKGGTGRPRSPWIGFLIFTGLWIAAFSFVLIRLIRFSLGSELESYIPLIPIISVYLLHLKRGGASALPVISDSGRVGAVLFWVASAGLLLAQVVLVSGGWIEGKGYLLFLPVTAFITGVIGGVAFFFGLPAFRSSLFPLLILYFMVPIPELVAHALRVGLQQGSADAAAAVLWLTGTPVLREGLNFCLPGLTIQVAEECSGIHSTLVLLIVSLVAGHLFLKKTWSRTLLALLVIPLGLVRNGIRVVALALLTVHVNAGIIDGPLHHRGGPVFFALS